MTPPEVLFYDGGCGLCHRAVRTVLASDRAGYLTGITVPIDGGELLTAGAEPGR